jgi:GNAT superfamily N-acetyltransferase
MELQIGPMRASEVGFVCKAWKFGLKDSPTNHQLPGRVFFARANAEVDEILAGATVLVARDPENADFAYGFVAFETTPDTLILHWVYVRDGFRRQKVALQLLSAAAEHTDEFCDRIYTPKTRFDAVAERMGFRHLNAFKAIRTYRSPK